MKTLISKIIERFDDANQAWRFNYHLMGFPFKVCVHSYILILLKGIK